MNTALRWERGVFHALCFGMSESLEMNEKNIIEAMLRAANQGTPE